MRPIINRSMINNEKQNRNKWQHDLKMLKYEKGEWSFQEITEKLLFSSVSIWVVDETMQFKREKVRANLVAIDDSNVYVWKLNWNDPVNREANCPAPIHIPIIKYLYEFLLLLLNRKIVGGSWPEHLTHALNSSAWRLDDVVWYFHVDHVIPSINQL